MARNRTTRLTALALANLSLPIAVLVFAIGFFPYKPLLPGLAIFDDVTSPELWGPDQPAAVFERVVFVVVDALRTDFVYGGDSGFEFTQSLIRDGAAVPFTAHATPPTVTMPRIKALTTGSVPSFADLIFNLDDSGAGTSLAGQDTWLAQIRAKGGKLVFYGDDTWLRLFPEDFFARADGTSSFFVSVSKTGPGLCCGIEYVAEYFHFLRVQDFTEVDSNVTRHVPHELERDDWCAMVLHYLGLDHIGHKTGPRGPNMLPKQREMDGIVKQIYTAMETLPHHANTLMVLLGDHGMNAGGNHGGSGPGETEPALLFASPKIKASRSTRAYESPTLPKEGTDFHYYRKVQQSDVVPTLASLIQLPVPKNSLGVFIEEFALLLPKARDAVQLMHQNAKQVKRIVQATTGEGDFARKADECRSYLKDQADLQSCADHLSTGEYKLPCLWASAEHNLDSAEAQATLLNFLTAAQEDLSNAASSYLIPWMLGGITLNAAALMLAILSFPPLVPPTLASASFVVVSILYSLMMFASSYVEEEQRLWYWLTPAWATLLTSQSIHQADSRRQKGGVATAGVLLLVLHRILISWNQTGQKHTGEPDIVHTFFPDNHVLMWILILATYGYITVVIARRSFRDLLPPGTSAIVALAVALPAVVFKLNFTQADAPELVRGLGSAIRELTEPYSLVLQAQIFFVLLAIATLAVVALSVTLARSTVVSKGDGPAVRVTLAERLHHLLTIFLMTQSRAPNVPIFLGLELQRKALAELLKCSVPSRDVTRSRRSANISPAALAVSSLLLSHVSFFCLGGSNSISSVDLSHAYNGIADYKVIAVGVLLFASNWSGPIWWASAAVMATFNTLSDPARALKPQKHQERQWVQDERAKLYEDDAGAKHPHSSAGEIPEHWLTYVSWMTAFVATSLLAIMTACTILRTHLFIWTVFSPKYLYAMAWCVGWHLTMNLSLGSLLRSIGLVA